MAIAQRGSPITIDLESFSGTVGFAGKPTGTEATDILVAVWTRTDVSASIEPPSAMVASGGWTEVTTAGGVLATNLTKTVRVQVFWAPGDIGDLTFYAENAFNTGAVLMAFSGVDLSAPIEDWATATAINEDFIDIPSIDIVTDQSWELIGYGNA